MAIFNLPPPTMIFSFLFMFWCLSTTAFGNSEEELISLNKLPMFVDDLPDMPKLLAFHAHRPNHLQIGMFFKTWKFHRDLPPTPVFAYGISKESATVPGPTIEAIHGISTYVTWQNHLPPKHILPWDPPLLKTTSALL